MKKNKIYLSDIYKLIALFTQEKITPHVFDPFGRLVDDLTEKEHDSDKLVLVNLAGKLIQFKGYSLSEFDFVLDFGNAQVSKDCYKQSFCSLNHPNGKMRWLYRKGNLKGVLAFYNNAGVRGKIISKCIQVLNTLRLGSLIAKENVRIYSKEEFPIKSLISAEERIQSIFMGTPGVQQTALLSLKSKGKIKRLLKVPFSEESIRLMENEKRAMADLGLSNFRYLKLPKVGLLHGRKALLTENLKNKRAKHVEEFTNVHALALEELHFKGRSRRRSYFHLSQCTFWNSIEKNLEKGSPTNELLKPLYQLSCELYEHFNATDSVVISSSHGDFTPWNMFLKKDRLLVYDWEMYSSQGPALFDFFHFHYQRGILMQKVNQQEIVKQFSEALLTAPLQRIQEDLAINVDQLHRLYLLRTISYFIQVYDKQELTVQNDWQLATWEDALKAELIKCEAEKIGCRQAFLADLNIELQQHSHAFLKFDYESLAELPASSDLDLAVGKNTIPSLTDFCSNHPLVQRIKHNAKSFMSNVELFFNDGEFLSLDLIHRFQRKSLNMFSTEELLEESRKSDKGIVVPALKHDLAYTFLFYTLNNAPIPLRYHRLFRAYSAFEKEEALLFLFSNYGVRINKIARLFTDGRQERPRVVKALRSSNSIARITDRLNYAVDVIKAFIKPEGFMITFSGVDGVGKSTVLKLAEEKLRKQYRKEVVLLRHRPGILPILSALKHGKEKAEQIASVTIPRKGKNKSGVSSMLRFAYYFADYFFGQLYVYFKYIARGKVVLYDRYYFDFINDARRSNISINRNIAKALYGLILKPRLNIFLYAKPAVVLARKQELEKEDIIQLNSSYKNLFEELKSRSKNSRYTSIENLDLDNTLNQILSEYKQVV